MNTRKLEDFELFGPNLIEGLTFDFGFTFRGNNRAIQKADKEALQQSIVENFKSIEFIKEGPDCDFVLFGSKPEHDEVIRQGLEKEEEEELKKKKWTLISAASFGTILFVGILASGGDFSGSLNLFFYVGVMIIGSTAFIIRKKIESKKTESIDRLGQFKRSKELYKGLINPLIFFIPIVLLVVYLFQFNANFRMADWGVECLSNNNLQWRAIFTATFVQSNLILLVISILICTGISAVFLKMIKLQYLLLVFIVTAVTGNLVYNLIGSELLYGAGTGISGIWAAYLVCSERVSNSNYVFLFTYWIIITLILLAVLIYFSEWQEYLQYVISFWVGAVLGLFTPMSSSRENNPLTESNEEAN